MEYHRKHSDDSIEPKFLARRSFTSNESPNSFGVADGKVSPNTERRCDGARRPAGGRCVVCEPRRQPNPGRFDHPKPGQRRPSTKHHRKYGKCTRDSTETPHWTRPHLGRLPYSRDGSSIKNLNGKRSSPFIRNAATKTTNLWRTITGRARFYVENHASKLALTRTPATGEQCEHAGDVPRKAHAQSRPLQRTPPLPRGDLKVIIRPSPGLIVRELRSHQVANAIIQATGLASACKGEDFIVRLRRGSNIITTTPPEATAATLVKITSLTFQE
ncbi:hypothetical protein MTO96_006229 [Rhipicephalus appendiculatus]